MSGWRVIQTNPPGDHSDDPQKACLEIGHFPQHRRSFHPRRFDL